MRQTLSKIWSPALFFCTFIMIAAFQNCGNQGAHQLNITNPLGPITMNGTVQKSTLDGCQYLISVVDKATGEVQEFVPQHMDPNLLVAGNEVLITGLPSDEASDCMAGPLFQVQEASLVSN
jgi:hypothetical protein